MSRTIFGLCFLFLLQTIQAQTRSGDLHVYPSTALTLDGSNSRSATEEVLYPTFGDECTLELVTIGVQGIWGRVSGMNGFGDLEKAQRLEFSSSDSYKVMAALVFFEVPSVEGNGLINVKVYEVDPETGGPGVLRGFSDAKKVDEIVLPDSIARATMFPFESGVSVDLDNPRFFVSCDFSNLYGTRDTVVMLQTIEGCGDGANTWELFADGITWGPIISDLSWQLNADFVMGAVVDFDEATSANSFIASGDLQIHPSHPNPATDHIFLNYTLVKPSQSHVEIYDISGRLVRKTDKTFVLSGRQQTKINLINLTPGQYFYRIVTEKESLTSLFIVR